MIQLWKNNIAVMSHYLIDRMYCFSKNTEKEKWDSNSQITDIFNDKTELKGK